MKVKTASTNPTGRAHTKGGIDHDGACRGRRDIDEEGKRGQDL